MSESGVIPYHGPREIGRLEDVDGVPVIFSLNHDGTVRIAIEVYTGHFKYAVADLDKDARERFMRLWCEAERQVEGGGQ